MWELSSQSQIFNFFYAIITGGIFSVIYDIFKSFRLKIKCSTGSIFFQDILYFSVIAVMAFCFFLTFCSGEIRFYIFLGFISGFVLARLTISKILMPVFKLVLILFSSVIGILNRFFNAFYSVSAEFLLNIRKFLKNTLKTLKKLLKKGKGMLYTMEE